MGKRKTKSERIIEEMMREVHTNIPSTVRIAGVSGKKKKQMLKAIALSKARAAGAKIPAKTR